jgi:adenine-specific DNA-methyltransferase
MFTLISEFQKAKLLEGLNQKAFKQFFTPAPVAEFMASLFSSPPPHLRLLDAGAGHGALTSAVLQRAVLAGVKSAHATLYELDSALLGGLNQTLEQAQTLARDFGLELHTSIINADFLQAAQAKPLETFSHAILNPPYGKLARQTALRRDLETAGIDATNLYSAFLDLTVQLLAEDGELVAITPRSFFNGLYFTPFRQRFLGQMRLQHIRLFDSRRDVFAGVLQETVIVHAIKTQAKQRFVSVSRVLEAGQAPVLQSLPYTEVVRPTDSHAFIRVSDSTTQADWLEQLPNTLESLGLKVSTGKVVDFRCLPALRSMPEAGDHALIYPTHLQGGTIEYPKSSAKANAVVPLEASRSLLVPEGFYVLIKRFSAKEEPRRVVAALYEPEKARFGAVGFENHLNFIHQNGHGLARDVALGLVAYLNSSAFDAAFRVFSGHTQVNATDLRSMKFPSMAQLKHLATRVSLPLPSQAVLDDIVVAEVSPYVNA